jgi:hypothetical protein
MAADPDRLVEINIAPSERGHEVTYAHPDGSRLTAWVPLANPEQAEDRLVELFDHVRLMVGGSERYALRS